MYAITSDIQLCHWLDNIHARSNSSIVTVGPNWALSDLDYADEIEILDESYKDMQPNVDRT